MSNPSKAKGTGGENEAAAELIIIYGRTFARTTAGEAWDLHTTDDVPGAGVANLLMTRPDYGRWLLTGPPDDLRRSFLYGTSIRVEVKRYHRFALHTIYEKKFGRKA